MKQQISLAVAALISTSSAIKTPDGSPIYPAEFHFNEDPHSVPDPIAGKKYMTTTQAKYLAKDTWDTDTEDTSIDPNFHGQFNWRASAPKASQSWMTKYWTHETQEVGDDLKNQRWQDYVQLNDKANESSDSDSDSSSDSDSDSEDEAPKKEEKKHEEKKPEDKKNLMWQVTPDLGELDDHATLFREFDQGYPEKAKFSGWTHPLGWTDGGDDDDLVLVQLTANGIKERRVTAKEEQSLIQLQYKDSEGPTKVDFGELDNVNIGREADNDYKDETHLQKGKFHGWTNPLGWTDDGTDDPSVI